MAGFIHQPSTMTSSHRLLSTLLSISSFAVLIATVAVLHADRVSSTSVEIDANANTKMAPPPFPAHWGPPPSAQTRDLVQLPGEYGRGSGTLRRWILEKMAEDEKATWPEKNLVGVTGEEAKAAVLAGKSEILEANVHILPHDAMVTEDYREDRVRIFVGDDGKVVRQPMIG